MKKYLFKETGHKVKMKPASSIQLYEDDVIIIVMWIGFLIYAIISSF